MDSGETEMNPVAITIINPRKEYRLSRESNQGPHIVKSCTELWGSARGNKTEAKRVCKQTLPTLNDSYMDPYPKPHFTYYDRIPF